MSDTTTTIDFSILQWNVWYKEDPDNIVRLLKEQNADIICLQELTINPSAPVQNVPEYLAAQLDYNVRFKELPIESTDGKKIAIANGILSRFPIVDFRTVWINEPNGSGSDGGYDNEYRVYVEVTLAIHGRRITVGTTHMSYTHKFVATPNKKAETDRLITELQKHTDNFIFTGDLNAPPGSYTINAIDTVLQNCGPDTQQNTWTTKPFNYNNFAEDKLMWRLDYVFATHDLQNVSAKILTTHYSDHLPILVHFSQQT